MLRYLILLFVALPLVDMVFLLYLAQIIGIVEAVLLVVFTGIVGASLIKHEGINVLRRLQQAVYMDEVSQTVVEGALLLAGGVFLLSPGVITDLCGFTLVFSWTRQRLATWLREYLQASNNVQVSVRGFDQSDFDQSGFHQSPF